MRNRATAWVSLRIWGVVINDRQGYTQNLVSSTDNATSRDCHKWMQHSNLWPGTSHHPIAWRECTCAARGLLK